MALPRRLLDASALDDLVTRITQADVAHAEARPGGVQHRQPLHTLYVPANHYTADLASRYGQVAVRLLHQHASDASDFGDIFNFAPDLATSVRERVVVKLQRDPVEDYRIDFEDGYGRPDDDTEDTDAVRAATEVADAAENGELPDRWGLRVKSFTDGLYERSIRTLDVFLSTLSSRLERVPEGFVVTFPKIVATAHVAAFADLLGRLEEVLGLATGTLMFEVQIETPESVIDHDGVPTANRLVDAAGGRLSGAHMGVFDYTAALGLPPDQQRLDHPSLDFARHLLQVALAGTGVELSDGSTNVAPVDLDDVEAVHRAWRAHAAHVRHSLRHGYPQGWDLHAAHLVSRFTAVYGFYLDGMDSVLTRVRAWQIQEGAREVLDEPATITTLLAHVRRATAAGALDASEVADVLGLAKPASIADS